MDSSAAAGRLAVGEELRRTLRALSKTGRVVATGLPTPNGYGPAGGGRTWWAHFEFTRINTTPTILRKSIEDLRQLGAFILGDPVRE